MIFFKKIIIFATIFFFILFLFSVIVNLYIFRFSSSSIYEKIDNIPSAQAVLILGSKVYDNGQMSDVLLDRVLTAIELYEAGKVEKILISGDHGQKIYDEVNTVKNYLLEEKKIPAKDIFLDHAGFDTYDSLYRAKDIFQVKSIIISSQKFHLPRAVYIGKKIGLETSGIIADKHIYFADSYNNLRESLSRIKAFLNIIFHSKPKFLGEVIPINGESEKSWD